MRTTKSLIFLLISILLISSCKNTSKSKVSDERKYSNYLNDVTGGVISRKDAVQLVLAKPVEGWTEGKIIDDTYFSVSPSVEGQWTALNPYTVSFIPKSEFQSDTEYTFTVDLNKLIHPKEKIEDYVFKIKTIKQDFIVKTEDVQSYDKNWQYLRGYIYSSDLISLDKAKKLVTASQEGKKLTVRFTEFEKESKHFSFIVDSIQRLPEASKVIIKTNGSPINVKQNETYETEILGVEEFKVVGTELLNEEKTFKINFSNKLDKNQNLKGLVALEGISNIRTSVQGNTLTVYFPKTKRESSKLEVFSGIKSVDGYKLKEKYTENIVFERIKPQVRLLKSGTILPHSEKLNFSFEAVNLKAVDFTIYKIYENNVLQFLQDNDLNGKNNLRRVARPIAKKKYDLQSLSDSDLSDWNAFAVDLSDVISVDRGAIYRVKMSFKKSYSLYKCEGESEEDEKEEVDNFDEEEQEKSYWDSGAYSYDDDYDWREQDNPCDKSYYKANTLSTNLLASNIGVTVKKGVNNDYFIAVCDIRTTKLLSNVKVTFYNYQQQEIGSITTNNDGIAYYDLDKKAYFAKATKDGESTYVKLADGNALSISKYDVSGAENKKGLKGYIYGERGVWRPGDKLYLSFMLNDKDNKLPENHPVKMELIDPQGTTVYRKVETKNLNQLYNFTIPTSEDYETGNWQARVSVGGAKFTKQIKIETIKPNRLKLNIDFNDKMISNNQEVTMNLTTKWLHGAVAGGLKADMDMMLYPQKTVFKAFPGYTFDDPARNFYSDNEQVYEGTVDENGKAKITFKAKLGKTPPGMLKAVFLTKAYEKGGDFSTDVFTRPFSPYTSYVGLSVPKGDRARNMLLTDTKHRFDIATVDENGKPIAVKDLEVRIYKVNHSWWWDASKGNLSQYDGSSYKESVFDKKISTNSRGTASFKFELKYPKWGRYLVRVLNKNSGHATGKMVFIDWPGWAGKARKGNPDEATMLAFALDKDKYNVGETAEVTIPTTADSKALITIENGTKVLEHYWVTTQKANTKFSFTILPEMAPNVFVSVSTIQKHANTKNDLPIRRYGIKGIMVEDPNTRLYPEIKMPNVLAPDENVNISVKEKNGKPMTYTIAIVDDGLLDLTRFKTPNPWSHFYQKQALGVKMWDIYDDIIGAYGGKLNQAFSVGGDGALAGGKNKKANRFEPVVIHLGPFEIKANETKTHNVKIPKYVGSVRTMIVAQNKNTAYGNAEKTTPVRKPLMLLASIPRKVTPGETVTIPVTVFAMEDKIRNVNVKLRKNKNFEVVGNATQQLHFPKVGEKMAFFKVKVLENGIGKMNIEATGSGERASYDLEIDALNPNVETRVVEKVVVEPNMTKNIHLSTFGTPGTNYLIAEISSMPHLDFNSRLQYLIKYPHGCAEQTTSGAFPQLYLSQIFDLSATKKQQIKKNVQAGITKLARFQKPNGGFSYWQGQSNVNDWVSSYVGHFFIEAEKKGYILPNSFKNKWVQFQTQTAKQWRPNSNVNNGLAQAYRLYTLALSGNPDLSSMNRLRETKGISSNTKLRLAGAYALIGKTQVAKTLVNTTDIGVSNSKENVYSYGSKLRNQAMILETMILINNANKAKEIGEIIASKLSGNDYMSTQTTAYSLMSMARLANYIGGKGLNADLSLNGANQKFHTQKTMMSRKLMPKNGENTIKISNAGDNKMYVSVVNCGILPVGKEKVEQKGLIADIKFKNTEGKIIDVTKLKQSTDFVAQITITNQTNENVKDLALTNIIPSGWEIVNTRFTNFEAFPENQLTYEDIRDDRSHFYFDLGARKSKTIRVLLNASYLGRYYLPGLQCEAMYNHNYLVRTKGQWVEVLE